MILKYLVCKIFISVDIFIVCKPKLIATKKTYLKTLFMLDKNRNSSTTNKNNMNFFDTSLVQFYGKRRLSCGSPKLQLHSTNGDESLTCSNFVTGWENKFIANISPSETNSRLHNQRLRLTLKTFAPNKETKKKRKTSCNMTERLK